MPTRRPLLSATVPILRAARLPGTRWVTGNAKLALTNAIRDGRLYVYTQAEGIYRCPVDKYCWQAQGTRRQLEWDYGLSVGMHGGNDTGWGKQLWRLVLVKSSEIRHPAGLFTFIDKDAKDAVELGGTGMFSMFPLPWTEWDSVPADRDAGRGVNLAFADGHVEAHKWKWWPKRRGNCTQPQDKEDLQWLQDRFVEPE